MILSLRLQAMLLLISKLLITGLAKLVKLDILVNSEPVEGLAQVIPVDKAEEFGKKLVAKLKDEIPRQNIPIPVQAVINYAKIKGGVGRKDFGKRNNRGLSKRCYCKTIRRGCYEENKASDKQKKGKKRMKRFGNVEIPQEAFLAVLKI